MLISDLLRRVRAWRARGAAIAELNGFDDLLLTDLGISRAEIPAYVDGMIERAPPRVAEVIPFPRAASCCVEPRCCAEAA